MIRVINLVDSVAKVNLGIFNAAVITALELQKNHQVESEIWYPANTVEGSLPDFKGATPVALKGITISDLKQNIKDRDLNPATCLIISHGSWRYPSKWGAKFKSMDYKWMHVPHGMLEPWSMLQKALKKKIYFSLVEKPAIRNADVLRAVSSIEGRNLKKDFSRIIVIPNSVKYLDFQPKNNSDIIHFLFMGRMHAKKGVLPLVKAWIASSLKNNSSAMLHIAGPDEGEAEKIGPLLAGISNAKYYGGVYGAQKEELLVKAHYFVLPTQSEGFPTAVVEAIMNGTLPIITTGCNFPEMEDKDFCQMITTEEESIKNGLEITFSESVDSRQVKSKAGWEFISKNYNTTHLAKIQFEFFSKILANTANLPGLLK
jgi:glycosyltransferase involved in cell wall biosynthesis